VTEDRGGSFMDKVKDALGMGDRDRDETYTGDRDRDETYTGDRDRDETYTGDLDPEAGTRYAEPVDRDSAGAGVVVGGTDAHELGGDVNRPAGPDYGADDTAGPELGVGLDREGTAGTGEHNTGTGLGYDYDRNAVTDPGPLGTEPTFGSTQPTAGSAGAVGEPEWTRGGAASGESALDADEENDRRAF